MPISEVRFDVAMPEALASRVRLLASRDCSSVAATVRRLLVRGLEGESEREMVRQLNAIVKESRS
jgi:hypothetical protein